MSKLHNLEYAAGWGKKFGEEMLFLDLLLEDTSGLDTVSLDWFSSFIQDAEELIREQAEYLD